jgi:septum site-determining protein MinC
MVSNSSTPPVVNEPSAHKAATEDPNPVQTPETKQQIQLTSQDGCVHLVLPSEVPLPEEESAPPLPWAEWLQQIRLRLDANERFWQANTEVHLQAQERLLDIRQLQALAELLSEHDLKLKRVITQRRQTALAAVTAGYSVEQPDTVNHLVQSPQQPGQALSNPLYLQTTVRSGIEIRHPGTIIILGDTNPGSSLLASGDILVWGRLRGMAHAGIDGNRSCRIMALHMQPTQLRIADLLARPPETPPANFLPEVAYVGDNAIRIAVAQDFARQHLQPSSGLAIP